MNRLNLATMRAIERDIAAQFTSLITWSTFSLDAVQQAVAKRVGGEIVRHPFHWEACAYFGLTLGYQSVNGPRWLILYEPEAVAEHHLMIVLHELMHIAMGHCGARLTPRELRVELRKLGLIDTDEDMVTH